MRNFNLIQHLTRFLTRIYTPLTLVVFFFFYPFLAIAALPWAILDSLIDIDASDSTALAKWKESWNNIYSVESLKSFWLYLTKESWRL